MAVRPFTMPMPMARLALSHSVCSEKGAMGAKVAKSDRELEPKPEAPTRPFRPSKMFVGMHSWLAMPGQSRR